MTLKIIFNGKQVGYVFAEFKNYTSYGNDDEETHEELDFIDPTSIIQMHEEKEYSWGETCELDFSLDSMFFTAEARDKAGDMLHKRIIPTKSVVHIYLKQKDDKNRRMKEYSKDTVKSAK
jgi:hypothetical protein